MTSCSSNMISMSDASRRPVVVMGGGRGPWPDGPPAIVRRDPRVIDTHLGRKGDAGERAAGSRVEDVVAGTRPPRRVDILKETACRSTRRV